jgi:hypothetical protein
MISDMFSRLRTRTVAAITGGSPYFFISLLLLLGAVIASTIQDASSDSTTNRVMFVASLMAFVASTVTGRIGLGRSVMWKYWTVWVTAPMFLMAFTDASGARKLTNALGATAVIVFAIVISRILGIARDWTAEINRTNQAQPSD